MFPLCCYLKDMATGSRQNADPLDEVCAALYIKLGAKGIWESDCLLREQTIRLGYQEIPTNLATTAAASGDWHAVEQRLVRLTGGSGGVARRHLVQIRHFFEADERILWITFFQQRLWWCRSPRQVRPTSDGHSRPVVGGWSSEDTCGRPLNIWGLSGRLTAVQGFRGTICSLKAPELRYLLTRIRGEQPESVRAATEARAELESRVQHLIESLTWRDFETFVDLLFRQAGLQRTSEVGKTMHDVDIHLTWPLTGERYAAQVKARGGVSELHDLERAFVNPRDFARIYLVVHTPDPALLSHRVQPPLEIIGPQELSQRAVKHGLVDWLVERCG